MTSLAYEFVLVERTHRIRAALFDVSFNYANLSSERASDFVADGWLEDEDGKMYFGVRPCTFGFQCWSLGDDSSPLAPDEAYKVGVAAPTVWLALPESLRNSLHNVNKSDAT